MLEFGAGQSTLWWARRASHITAIEGDAAWLEWLKPRCPENVELHLVPVDSPSACIEAVGHTLKARAQGPFDVVVIDGHWRYEMIDIAAAVVSADGIIVCDNAEGYGFQQGFKDRPFLRADFFGYAPGVVLPHCTSIYFRPESIAFHASHPIPVIALEQ